MLQHIFLSIILCVSVWCNLPAQSFDGLLEKIDKTSVENQNAVISDYIKSLNSIPIIDGNEVIFLIDAGNSQPVLLADFNGFLNPRYIEDASLGKMTQLGATNWYYKRKQIDENAIINYKYRIDDKSILDPFNNLKRDNFGELVSYIRRSSKYESKIFVESIKGHLIDVALKSKSLDHTRSVIIYTPPGYAQLKDLSSVYFHDGSFHLNNMQAASILDSLIVSHVVEPLIAVFDNPVTRGKEYRGDEAYRKYISEELIPYVDSLYGTSTQKARRGVIGFSRGGMSALYISHSTPHFSKVGVFSPAIHPKSISDFIAELDYFTYKPDHYYITASTYDYIWYNDAIELVAAFNSRGVDVDFQELPMGHNLPAWQIFLDEMLVSFFGISEE